MLEQGEILTLDDNKKYIVVFSCIYQEENYAYLVEQQNYKNTMFCKFDNQNGLEEVTDQNIITEILRIFVNK